MRLDHIDTVIEHVQTEASPPTLEDYIRGERLLPFEQAEVCLRMIELAAMQHLVDKPGYRDQYIDGLRGYIEHIQPLIHTAQTDGFEAADAIIIQNWRMYLEAEATYQGRSTSLVRRPHDSSDEATAAYSRLALTNEHRLTATSKVAIWLLYIAEPGEAAMFCEEHNLLAYLADAPKLVNFLAEDRVRNGITAGEDGLMHVNNVRPYITRYMRDYKLERSERPPDQRLYINQIDGDD